MSSASSMAPTFSDTKPQSAWVTPSGLSMAMRTNRALPPPLTSTSTSSRPSDCATRCAISSIFAATIATTSRIVPDLPPPTKKWAFAHRIGSTTQTTVYRVYGNCGRAEYGGAAISHPGARRRVKSLWERDFCVKCDEAHCGARVLGPLGTRVPDSRASPDHFWDGGKTWWSAAAMAADLTVVEDHRQRVGKDTDHGQHDEGTVLMGGGLLQVTIRGEGLKGLHVDRPAAASELVDEIRRNGAKIHVRRIEVGADHGSGLFGFCPRALGLRTLGICTLRFFRFRLFDLGHLDWTLLDLDGLGVLHPNRLDDAHDPVGHGPVHLRQVPEL